MLEPVETHAVKIAVAKIKLKSAFEIPQMLFDLPPVQRGDR